MEKTVFDLEKVIVEIANELGFTNDQRLTLRDLLRDRLRRGETLTIEKVIFTARKLLPPLDEKTLIYVLKKYEPNELYQLFFLTTYYGALRAGETLGLMHEDVIMEEDATLLRIERQRTDSRTRGNGGRLPSPLKRHSKRMVPVPKHIGELLLATTPYPVVGGDEHMYFIFPFLPRTVRLEWEKIRELALQDNITLGSLHYLRSSRLTYWATRLSSSELSQISGNSITVLEAFYRRSGLLLNKEDIIKKAL